MDVERDRDGDGDGDRDGNIDGDGDVAVDRYRDTDRNEPRLLPVLQPIPRLQALVRLPNEVRVAAVRSHPKATSQLAADALLVAVPDGAVLRDEVDDVLRSLFHICTLCATSTTPYRLSVQCHTYIFICATPCKHLLRNCSSACVAAFSSFFAGVSPKALCLLLCNFLFYVLP